jgi:hypothetical protein
VNSRGCAEQPHQNYTFVCGHGGILPALGTSNEVGQWIKKPKHSRGGYWNCTRCHQFRSQQAYRGLGPHGLLGRLAQLLRIAKYDAKRRGYIAPITTPDNMLKLWYKQSETCAACGGFLQILKAHFDHDHRTGKPRGFIHRHCNLAEGILKNLTRLQFQNWIRYVRPNGGYAR